MREDVALKAAVQVWDDDRTPHPHGPTGIVIVPRNVAQHLLRNGGYGIASPAHLQAEVDLLEARIAALKEHL